MKKNKILRRMYLFLSLIFFTLNSFCQPPDSLWMLNFGGAGHDLGFDVMEDDYFYYAVGKTKSFGNGGYDAYVVKLDNNGGVIWEKTYGGALDEQIVSICPALYQGFMLAGYTSTDAQGISDIWILYINEEGDSLASVKYGGLTSDQAYCIRPNVDQGYIVTSRTSVYQWGDQVYLMKLDVSLDTIWTKTFGGPSQDYGHWVEETSDYGYIVAGRTYTSSAPETGDAWAIRTDNNGDTLWTRKYGGDDEDIFYAVTETDDGFLFAGQTWSSGAGLIDVYVVRTDYNGDTIWTKTYGGSNADYAFRIFKTGDDAWVIAGYSESLTGSRDVFLIRIDINGNLLWADFYGDESDNEYMYGGNPTSDGGFIFAGKNDKYFGSDDDMFVLKLGPEGLGVKKNNGYGNHSIEIYPNPSDGVFTLEIQGVNPYPFDIEINDVNGIVRKARPFNTNSKIMLDMSGVAPGTYLIRVVSGNSRETVKAVVR
ncbi:MAG: T9SS type A sorting domain-containing protein [Bacteroidales bacterium]|nr:T9SS type A sorting domain-containing protein [Bacteroidales bacterium]